MTANIWSPQPGTVTQANASGLVKQELTNASEGQRLFNINTFAIAPGTGALKVYVNGKALARNVEFVELNNTQFILVDGAKSGDKVLAEGFVGILGSAVTDNILRQDLLGNSGANNVGFTAAASGASNRTVNSKLSETVSVKDFGAKGDGATDDINAIQAAIDFVEANRGTVIFPDGHYVISQSIRLPSFVTLKGSSVAGTVIDNQYVLLHVPQLINKDPGNLIFACVENIVFRGGSHGFNFNVTGETAGNRFRNLVFELQTDFNVRYNRLMQTTTWENCNFDGAAYGVFVEGWTANANVFNNCSFTNHAWSSVYLRGSEVNNFTACRFEGGGQLNRSTIDVTDSRNMNFKGCYFENTHTYAISEAQSSNSITFDDCHFTGATDGAGGFAPYKFSSDGMLIFGSNHWGTRTDGSAAMYLKGYNGKDFGYNNKICVAESRPFKHYVSASFPCPPTLQKDLLSFTRVGQDGSLTNSQILTGVLTINAYFLEAGGFDVTYSRRYMCKVFATGIANVDIALALDGSCDNERGRTLTIQKKAGATPQSATLEMVLTGLTPGTQYSSVMNWSFECISASTNEPDSLKVNML